jgi:putative ABC transport system substrate-binding protein
VIQRRDFITLMGGAAAWPLAVRAQQPAMPVVGYLSANNGKDAGLLLPLFRRGLGEQGFVEGRNVEILYRYAEGQYDLLPVMAADLVRRKVAVIAAVSGPRTALAAKAATATIPIVFREGGDPVALGLVASLNRPGGNVTGITIITTTLLAKRLELLHQIAPAATSVGFLLNPALPQTEVEKMEAEAAARALGLRFVILNASTPAEIDAQFALIADRQVGALVAQGDPLYWMQRDQLAALAARYAVPTIYSQREHVDAGGLISYGAMLADSDRLLGAYVGRILKGDKPADLPVQQSTRLEMVVNSKVAKALGLTIPETLLATADEVIQ